jgi:hypothetical protein
LSTKTWRVPWLDELQARFRGFDLIEADSLEEAVEIAAAHPAAQSGTIEVRPHWGS